MCIQCVYLYLSALFTTLASSFDVDAAFTSLFLFSSELSQVLLWERSIPEDRFTLGPLNTHTHTNTQNESNSGSDDEYQEEEEEVTVNHWASSWSVSIRLLCLSSPEHKTRFLPHQINSFVWGQSLQNGNNSILLKCCFSLVSICLMIAVTP